jgi:hypothetical protein
LITPPFNKNIRLKGRNIKEVQDPGMGEDGIPDV